MTDLFATTETLSPRLAWIKKHEVRTQKANFVIEGEDPWVAWIGDLQRSIEDGTHETGATEDDAITALAKACGWPLWNEEGFKQ